MDAVIAARIEASGVELIPQSPPRHPYDIATRDGNVLYLSGKTAMRGGKVVYSGPLRTDDDIARGRDAARLCATQLLSALEYVAGLENVTGLLKLTVFVASAPSFTNQAEVANAASELMHEVLGDAGRHARSAVGVAVLPGDTSVEINLVARVRSEDAA